MPKVSVIVPVYGVEKYIERCARSLFEQTLDDIEFIFVDDCTPDNSISVLKNVIKSYPGISAKIRIINHDKNKGLPTARKTGVSYATGDFIIHCDSDDWVEPQMYEALYNKAIADNADIVWCDYFRASESDNIVTPQRTLEDKIDHIKAFLRNKIIASTCNSLVKRELYNNGIKFSKSNMLEDLVIMTQLYFYSNKIAYLNEPLYYYRINLTSICKSFTEAKVLSNFQNAIDNTTFVHSFLKSKGFKDLDEYSIRGKIMIKNILLPLLGQTKYQKLWLNTYPEVNRQILIGKEFEMKVYFEMLILLFHRIIPNFIFRKIALHFSR